MTHAGLLLMTPVPFFAVDGHLITPTREGKQHCCVGTVCYLGIRGVFGPCKNNTQINTQETDIVGVQPKQKKGTYLPISLKT